MDRTIAVLGAVLFGTAIASILAVNGREIWLWSRDASHMELLKSTGENTRSLPGYRINESVVPTSNLEACLNACRIVFFCIPSGAFREVVQLARPAISDTATVVSTTRGIEAAGFHLSRGR